MKPIVKLYIKVFLITGIVFGALISLLFPQYVYINEQLLIMSAGFGLLMSLSLVSIHWFALKQSGANEITKESLKVNQKRIIQSDLTLGQIEEKLRNDKYFSKMKIKSSKDEITIKMRMTWKSMGEIMQISDKNKITQPAEYLVTSKPKIRTTIVDYGKNFQNVCKIEKLIGL